MKAQMSDGVKRILRNGGKERALFLQSVREMIRKLREKA